MSYLVLARKYRPRNFREMVGQPHVVTALGNALVQKRLHHAYLFTGTRGVGKTTVSRILAKSLNCVGPDGSGDITAEPCGVCEVCRAIDAGNFVDYTELDAASNRGVDEVQQLLEQAVYKPVQGRFKVFMIDEVHMLTNTAFNAMLKTLEEPPEYLKFVLATTDPQKVPVTVLSRCLQFNLRPMAPETVRDHLAVVLQAESVPAEAGALTLLSRAARGSMRDALSLTDQSIAFGNGQVLEETVRQMLGAVDRQQVLGLVGALAQGNGAQILALIDQARASGLNAAGLLDDMAHVLQHMAVLQVVPQAVPADADVELQQVHALAAAMPRDETQLLYSICIHGKAELGLAPDEYAGLTMVLLRLLAYKPAEAEKKTTEIAVPPAGALTEASAERVGATHAAGVTLAPVLAVDGVAPAPVDLQPQINATVGLEAVPVPVPVDQPVAAVSSEAVAVVAADLAALSSVAADTVPAPAGGEHQMPVTGGQPTRVDPMAAVPSTEGFDARPSAKGVAQTAGTALAPLAVPTEPSMAHEPDLPNSSAPPSAVTPADPALASDDGWGESVWDDWHGEPETSEQAAPASMASAMPLADSLAPWDDLPAAPLQESVPSPEVPIMAPSGSISDTAVVADFEGSEAALKLVRTPLGDVWHGLVRQMVSQDLIAAFARELALQSQLVGQASAVWQLQCESALLGSASSVERLKTALAALGHVVDLEVTQASTTDTPALRNQHAQAVRLHAARQLLEQDPFVRALKQDFGATIIDQSVQPL